MKHTDELENAIEDLESVALRLAVTDQDTDQYLDAQHHYCAVLDDLINTYPIDSQTLIEHSEEVARIYHSRDHTKTALKHIETVHQAFLDETCDDYDPLY